MTPQRNSQLKLLSAPSQRGPRPWSANHHHGCFLLACCFFWLRCCCAAGGRKAESGKSSHSLRNQRFSTEPAAETWEIISWAIPGISAFFD